MCRWRTLPCRTTRLARRWSGITWNARASELLLNVRREWRSDSLSAWRLTLLLLISGVLLLPHLQLFVVAKELLHSLKHVSLDRPAVQSRCSLRNRRQDLWIPLLHDISPFGVVKLMDLR